MGATQPDSPSILVVEDDRKLADLYAEWLEESYAVETAYDGSQALERLDETVDVVLLDRMMPGLSGSEVLEAVRDAPVDPRVVMVSAVTPGLDIVQMGFDAYLEKPVDADVLHETVDRMLTRADYDEKVQALFSLIERQDTLEAVKSTTELETSEEYHSLTARLEAKQTAVEELLTDLPDDDFRVAVERLQRTAAERASERRYESLTADVLDSANEATVVIDADGSVVFANTATETLLGLDRADARGREYAAVAAEQFGSIEADDASLVSLIREGLANRRGEIDATVRVPEDGTRAERWLEYWSAPVETGLYAGGRIEHYHDVTGRYRREQYLQALHHATRELLTAETDEAVTTHAVTTATDELNLPYAAVFVRDTGTGDLVPMASETTVPDTDPDLPTHSGGSGPVWTAFADRTGRLTADSYRGDGTSEMWLDEAFDDWLVCPLGHRGVFLAATTDGDSLPATKQSLAQTWAASTRQALEQVARTRHLKDRDRQLERQNERLLRLDRINRLIRSLNVAVTSADTREEIETAVCRRLLRIGPVTGAWVASVDVPSTRTVCRASAGSLDEYLSRIKQPSPETERSRRVETTPTLPAREAYDARSTVSVTDLVTIDSGVWWRDRALEQGTNTIVAVPVVQDGTIFGAIEVHLDRPGGLSDDAVDALAELGVTIGHAIGAIRQRNALLSGGATTLTFRIDADSPLSRLTTDIDAPLTVTDVSRWGDGTCAVFTRVELDASHDRDRIARQVKNRPSVSTLRDDTDGLTCVLTLETASPLRQMVRHGGTLEQVTVQSDSESFTATVRLPSDTVVREYADAVTDSFDDIELVGKYDDASDQQPNQRAIGTTDARLTDRQRETLQMAFHAGYFDQPRSTDADSVAAELGIAQSTFSQHLRAAERKLLEGLFL